MPKIFLIFLLLGCSAPETQKQIDKNDEEIEDLNVMIKKNHKDLDELLKEIDKNGQHKRPPKTRR